jgi:hypothetical protein
MSGYMNDDVEAEGFLLVLEHHYMTLCKKCRRWGNNSCTGARSIANYNNCMDFGLFSEV